MKKSTSVDRIAGSGLLDQRSDVREAFPLPWTKRPSDVRELSPTAGPLHRRHARRHTAEVASMFNFTGLIPLVFFGTRSWDGSILITHRRRSRGPTDVVGAGTYGVGEGV